MKRLLTATVTVAFFIPGGSTTAADRCSYHWSAWQSEHFAGIVYAGVKNVPQHTLERLGYMESCSVSPGAVRRYNRQLGAAHYQRVSASAAPTAGSSDLGSVPGVPYSFASCVAFRESTDGRLSSNIYGILGGGGTGTVAQQKAAFSRMYAQYGVQPWAPYDGC
jgi:hypothetical protein